MEAYIETAAAPGGAIVLAVDRSGALVRLRFGDGAYECSFEAELAQAGFEAHPAAGQAAQAQREIEEYWAGARQRFDVALALHGTAWQIRVWEALTHIPFGETRTYAGLAAQLGRPLAARAVGRANATNPIPLVVPCHRLIGANGSLTGFGGGMHLKRRLLEHEAAVVRQAIGAGAVGAELRPARTL
jgi:methylated-DNA-[protein]-cysteine S-methyltransferase